jgi:hypothetical protein
MQVFLCEGKLKFFFCGKRLSNNFTISYTYSSEEREIIVEKTSS